jgi:hypothetical protein
MLPLRQTCCLNLAIQSFETVLSILLSKKFENLSHLILFYCILRQNMLPVAKISSFSHLD